MFRLAALMRSAITRRTPMILISSTPLRARDGRGLGRAAALARDHRLEVLGRDAPARARAAHAREIDARAVVALRRVAGDAMTRVVAREVRRCRRRRLRFCGGRRRPSRRVLRRPRLGRRGARGVERDQLGADGDHVARLAGEREHAAADRRRNLDRRLVGHDLGDDLVFLDRCRRP